MNLLNGEAEIELTVLFNKCKDGYKVRSVVHFKTSNIVAKRSLNDKEDGEAKTQLSLSSDIIFHSSYGSTKHPKIAEDLDEVNRRIAAAHLVEKEANLALIKAHRSVIM